ncbi:MAG: YihA family ribosome biogenesis GTP-binding protein [Clostridia bacterium]|nr:YihA family ribosome biogenesis GTP-binding protein [Clostridia bacterium]
MKIKQSDIAASAVHPTQYPSELLPQIVLFGRSNAGKSSLINALIERRNLARTSSAPGKTRLLNFYRIEAVATGGQPLLFYFVDLPGYGYAKVSRDERQQWLKRIEQFLRSDTPKLCWQLVDIRHQPSPEDISMYRLLHDQGYHVTLIANKADKIGRNARAKALSLISHTLEIPLADIVVFSAVTKEGKELLQGQAESYLLHLCEAQ